LAALCFLKQRVHFLIATPGKGGKKKGREKKKEGKKEEERKEEERQGLSGATLSAGATRRRRHRKISLSGRMSAAAS